METLTVCLPDDLAQAVAHEAALGGLSPADLVLQAVGQYCQRLDRESVLDKYVEEAARGYAQTALREEALATAEDAIVPGNEALARAEAVPQSATDEAWWR
jgi:hypothetical protein